MSSITEDSQTAEQTTATLGSVAPYTTTYAITVTTHVILRCGVVCARAGAVEAVTPAGARRRQEDAFTVFLAGELATFDAVDIRAGTRPAPTTSGEDLQRRCKKRCALPWTCDNKIMIVIWMFGDNH